MAEAKRIFWTEFEQSEVYRIFTEIVTQKKLPLPVPNQYGKDGSLVMNLLRQAQLVLPEKRRRSLANIDTLPAELGNRLVLNGFFPKNWKAFYRRGKKKEQAAEPEVDPNVLRIEELEAKMAEKDALVQNMTEAMQGLKEELVKLQNQPTPMQVLQRAIAETLAMALTMAEDAKKPGGFVRVQPGSPPDGMERRLEPRTEPKHDPYAKLVETPPVQRKVKVAVCGGMGADHAAIQRECGAYADLRFFEGGEQGFGDRLKGFKEAGFPVLVWSDHIRHQSVNALKYHNVPYKLVSGNLNKLIETVKATILEERKKQSEQPASS